MKIRILFTAFILAGCDFCDRHNHEGHAHAEDKHGKHEHLHEHEHHHSERCSHDKHEEHKDATLSHESFHKEEIKTIRIKKTAQEAMGLKTAKAEMRLVSSTYFCYGRFENVPESRQIVSTPISGRISILVKPLANVKKGDILFTVQSPEIVSRKREIEILEKRLKVYREIKTSNANLENELAVKRAEYASLIGDAEEDDGVISFRASLDGMVELFIAKNGDWLDIGGAVLQLINPQALRLKALIPSADAEKIKNGMKAIVGDFSGITRLGIGDDSGLVPLYVLFEGDINAIAGARGQAEIYTSNSADDVYAVPSISIVKINLEPMVFVKDPHDAEHFIAVPVKPGVSNGKWTKVEGLPNNAEVVVDGVYELKLAILGDKSKNTGHFHADGTFHDGDH